MESFQVSDTRKKDTNWTLPETATYDSAQLAVLMDIRDELKQLNRVFGCANFLNIPNELRKIEANTRKRKAVKK